MSTRTIDWETLCRQENGPREKEIVYQFSGGRAFKEPFDPTGTGIYQPIEEEEQPNE